MRRGRLRRRLRHRADTVGYWLIARHHHRLAITMWRTLRMWNTNQPGE